MVYFNFTDYKKKLILYTYDIIFRGVLLRIILFTIVLQITE